MSDNVVSLGGGPVESERRAAFLQSVAQSFDAYVTDYGDEPEAIVYVMAGITQASRIAWHIVGASESGVASVLSLAAVHCLTEAGMSRQGLT